MPLCACCVVNPAALKRPRNGSLICRSCFISTFETEVHQTITQYQLFKRGERVAIAASGGKDSTVLARVLTKLNKQYDYGLDLFLLSVDEGITGYRDDSLASVQRNHIEYSIPLCIVSYEQLYGWTMDQIVAQIGRKNNCTFCGVFRRQALDRGAVHQHADKLVTGHNADDCAETIVMNILRGDIQRLSRSIDIITGASDSGNDAAALPRCKPFKYCYEKEIVMYAYFEHLDYFSTECIYSPYAYRSHAREFIKQCERVHPPSIADIIRAGEDMVVDANVLQQRRAHKEGEGKLRLCSRCGYLSSNELCKACVLLEGLNRGRAKQRQLVMQEQEPEEESKVQDITVPHTITDEADDDIIQHHHITPSSDVFTSRKLWPQSIDVTGPTARAAVSAVFARRRTDSCNSSTTTTTTTMTSTNHHCCNDTACADNSITASSSDCGSSAPSSSCQCHCSTDHTVPKQQKLSLPFVIAEKLQSTSW